MKRVVLATLFVLVLTGCETSRKETEGINSAVAIAISESTSIPQASATPFVSDYKEDRIDRKKSLTFDVPLVRRGLPEEPDWSSFENPKALKNFCTDMIIPESVVHAFEKTTSRRNLESIFFLSSNGGYFEMQKKDDKYILHLGIKNPEINSEDEEIWGQGFFQNEKTLVLISIIEKSVQRQIFSFSGRIGSYVSTEPLDTFFQ